MHPYLRIVLVGAALAAASWSAGAGRPLTTDDAGTAPVGSCEIESWYQRADASHVTRVSGACGVAEGIELGVELERPSPRDEVRGRAGVVAKWAPSGAQHDTAIGPLALGVSATLVASRMNADGWSASESLVAGLATLEPAEHWALHANLGVARRRASGTTGSLLALAAEWSPLENLLVFVETIANDRRAEFGPAVRSVGGRWWLVEDRFGLDLVASREAGGHGTIWSIGFGWYGIGL
jgi:hypothetical protein